MLAFKPPLLFLLVPMLLVTRSFRTLAGLVVGGLGLAAVSLAVGLDTCADFLSSLRVYTEIKQVAPEVLRLWKYVDIRSALYPVFYHPSMWASAVLLALLLAGVVVLVRTWREKDWRVAWAATLIWTTVLSPHCAIYDTAILIPAAYLLASAWGMSQRLFMLLSLVYVVAWFSQPISQAVGFQPLTCAIIALGLWVGFGRSHRWPARYGRCGSGWRK